MIYKKPGEKFSYEDITYTAAYLPMKQVSTADSSGASLKFARMMTGKPKMIRRTSIASLTLRTFPLPAVRWSRLFLNSMVRQSVWRIWRWIWSSWRLKC